MYVCVSLSLSLSLFICIYIYIYTPVYVYTYGYVYHMYWNRRIGPAPGNFVLLEGALGQDTPRFRGLYPGRFYCTCERTVKYMLLYLWRYLWTGRTLFIVHVKYMFIVLQIFSFELWAYGVFGVRVRRVSVRPAPMPSPPSLPMRIYNYKYNSEYNV